MTTTPPPITFDYATWTGPNGLFPEFAGLNPTMGQNYFNIATATIIANATTNPAFNDGNLSTMCYLATSHIAWLLCSKDANGNPSTTATAQPASQQVGRLANATQGSVSAQFEWPGNDPSAQEKFLAQTKYGAMLWAMLAPYRTARYAAQPTFVMGGRFRFPLNTTAGLLVLR